MASAYTQHQIDQYVNHIGLPSKYLPSASPALDLDYLTALHIYQISSVPYENLILHYSSRHTVSLDPQFLFQKIVVDKRGRGGYCMENTIFFNHILRALGFTVYTAGVRIRPRKDGLPHGDYIGWVHAVNIVTLPSGAKYMLDVGFGGDQATKPLPLIAGHITQNLGPQQIRLIHDTIPAQVDKSRKLWIYQYRNGEDKDWNSFYCFPEFEFIAQDYEIMNFYTSQKIGGSNFQTSTVLIVRFLRGRKESEEGEDEGVVGKVMLVNGEVKRNMGGKTSVVKVCKTEEERVTALKEYFNITLTEEEKEGIRGRVMELVGA